MEELLFGLEIDHDQLFVGFLGIWIRLGNNLGDADGLPLLLENAFNLAPTNNNLNSPLLPQFARGTTAPAALVYGVPATPANFFYYLPQLSDDLMTWFGSDQYPQYFSISTSVGSTNTFFTVQPVVGNWPGDSSRLFMRLKIQPKP